MTVSGDWWWLFYVRVRALDSWGGLTAAGLIN